jgi:hypothetical protein
MTQDLVIKTRQDDILPFWKKLPFFFLFPFRLGPLVFLACLVLAAALAGLGLGAFGVVLKGMLVYFGLRYGFNILDLFSQGRFEGESVDHTLWGPEKRPAKLGLVLVLFIVLCGALGSVLVDARIARDPAAQDAVIERYRQMHAAAAGVQAAELQALERRAGLAPAGGSPAAPAETTVDSETETETEGEADPTAEPAPSTASAAPGAAPGPELIFGLAHDELLREHAPEIGERLWLQLLPPWYWAVVLLLSLMLPSAMIVIALDDAFFRALNPLNVVDHLQRMGGAYLVLWVFFLLIASARHAVLGAGADWPAALRLPLELGVGTYLGMVLCALMGYVLYQFHQEMHLDVQIDFDAHRRAGGAEAIARAGSAHKALRQADVTDPLERKLQPLLAEGKVKEAIAELKDQMRYARHDPALNTRLHELYALQGDDAATLAHGQQWLAALARAGQPKEALAAWRTLRGLDPAFEIQEGDAVLPIATAASRRGEHELAIGLMRGFDKRFPGHADLPGVAFLGARLLSEHARQHGKAAQLLRAVLARYPDHAIAGEARTYLTVLERMPGAG